MATSLGTDKILDFNGLEGKFTQLNLAGTAYSKAQMDNAVAAGAGGLTDLDLGASGTAGTLDVFPTTAAKGKLRVAAADSAGDTVTTITNASQTTTATMTIPDTNGNASFVMTAAAQTIGGAKTFSSDITLGAGTTLNLDSELATLSSHAATVTKYVVQVTSEALTTAAGASQAFVITLTGAAATDLAFVQHAGGTNTRELVVYKAVMTSNTCTVTISNAEPSNALNGTVIFNLWIVKA